MMNSPAVHGSERRLGQVLIVDDSQVIRNVAQRIVRALGFVTREAENGLEALNCCKVLMPDAILLDWNMPVMDGLAFLMELRQLDGGLHPKVVFCTTENEVPQITRALDAGADEYIMKPFDKDIVASKLEEVGLVARR
jgi:two-component system, chemotaxis family, chemotaxis protein CheY